MSSSDSAPRLLFAESTRDRPRHHLSANAGNPLVEVLIVDGRFNLVANGQGSLDVDLPQGTYLIKYRLGDTVRENWVDLNEDVTDQPASKLVPPSAAPIPGDTSWSPDERAAAEGLLRDSTLAVVVRDPKLATTPLDDVSIRPVENSRPVASLRLGTESSGAGWRLQTNAPVVGMAGNPTPGCYLLSVKARGLGTHEMAVWVAPSFQTRIFLTRRSVRTRKRSYKAPDLATASIHVVQPGLDDSTLQQFELMTEAARAALASERGLMPYEEIVETANEKRESPMLGLLGAHLLALFIESWEGDRDSTELERARRILRGLTNNLTSLLPEWPDVAALSPELIARFGAPPMLSRSWAAIAPGASSSAIPPGSYSSRIAAAVTAIRPWLVWDARRLLPSQVVPDAPWEALRSNLSRTLSDRAESRSSIEELLRRTPLQSLSSVEDLSRVWGVPQSTASASLSSVAQSKRGRTS